MSSKEEAAFAKRLEKNPTDIEAILGLCTILVQQGRPVPPALEEASLRHYLAADPSRNDLAYRLSTILMEQGRDVSTKLEEQALRHAITIDPGRLDLYDRFIGVALANSLGPSGKADAATDVKADLGIMNRARDRLARVSAQPPRSDLPSYGIRWQAYVDRMQAAIMELQSPAESLRYAQTKIGFEHRLSAGAGLQHHALYERELRTEFPQFASRIAEFDDPALSAPHTQFVLAGRPVSNIVPYLTRIIMSCLAAVPKPKTVVELGGGYGAPARLWLRNSIAPVANYIIVDIPQSLFFADVFLSSNFGAEAVYYVEGQEPLDPALLDRHHVILCPVGSLRAIEALPVDLVVNTGSLQEMSEDWVSYYMAWLDRQNTRFFYSLNYFAQPIGYLAESVNLWSPRMSPEWVARMLRWNPAMVRMQADRNYLESIYERTGEVRSEAEAQSRLSLLAERSMNGEVFMEYMDVFRRRLSPALALSIVRRTMSEMPFYPKEALWLAEWLLKDGRAAAAGAEAEVEKYRGLLAAQRAQGVEGTT